jgi:hypothetical protein
MLSLAKKKGAHAAAGSTDASPPATPTPAAVEIPAATMTTEPPPARGEQSPLTYRTLATPGCWD